MLKGLIPSFKQFKKWSLPSRLTFIGAVLSFVSLVFAVIVYLIPNNGNNIHEPPNSASKMSGNEASLPDTSEYSSFVFPFSFNSTNVLIVSFNDFQDHHENEKKIERIIQQRIADLKYENILSKETEFDINVKCLFLEQKYNDFKAIKRIGENCRADIVIYGDLFDVAESNLRHVQIKFLILPNVRRNEVIQGKTKLKKFTNWVDLVEGSLLKDIDYIVYWLIAYDQMDRVNIDSTVKITDYLSTKFENHTFTKFKKSLAISVAFEGKRQWLEEKNAEKAKSYYLKALEYDPDSYLAYFMLGLLFDRAYGDKNKAIEYVKKADELVPNDPTVLMELADLYYSKDDNVLSKKYANLAVQLYPDNVDANVLLGKILGLQFREYESAKLHLKKAIELDENSLYGHYFYSLVLFAENNSSREVLGSLSKVLEIDPNFSPAHNLMAFAYIMKHDYRKAEEHFLRAIKFDPEDEESNFWLAGLYFNQLSKPELGKKHMLEAIRINPDSARNHYHFAVELQRHLNDFKLAQVHYAKAKQIDPNFNGLSAEFNPMVPDD